MRYLAMIILVLFVHGSVYADVYVVYEKQGKEIISLSNENDCVLSSGMELEILKNINLKDIHLNYPPNMYTFQNKDIKPNMLKISAWEADKLARYEKSIERKKIDKKLLKDKIKEMKASGTVLKYKHVDEED